MAEACVQREREAEQDENGGTLVSRSFGRTKVREIKAGSSLAQ